MNEALKNPGHSLEVLRLIASSDAADAAVRQAAAVHFKNLVKSGWDEAKDVSKNQDFLDRAKRSLAFSPIFLYRNCT